MDRGPIGLLAIVAPGAAAAAMDRGPIGLLAMHWVPAFAGTTIGIALEKRVLFR
jgi:hypothetical protein